MLPSMMLLGATPNIKSSFASSGAYMRDGRGMPTRTRADYNTHWNEHILISACYPPRAEPVFASTIEDMTGRPVINVSKLAGKHTTSELTDSYSRNARLQVL